MKKKCFDPERLSACFRVSKSDAHLSGLKKQLIEPDSQNLYQELEKCRLMPQLNETG